MLGKRSRPAIGKLQNPLIPGDRFAIPDVVTSPKSPLDFVIRSPRGIKGGEVGGVGLGIVAALDKAGGGGSEIQAKVLMGSLSLNRSSPIPVGSAKNSTKSGSEKGPNNFNFTRVHCNGDEYGSGGHDRTSSDRSCMNWGVFCESQPRVSRAVRALPGLDFLNSCHSCRKKLHGKDIYMYRGEKAFCSNECRYRQIVMDERKEMCGSEASRSAEMAGSPYSGGQLFSTGIIAA